MIKGITLSKYAIRDKLIWPYTKDMKYTVKLGYWAAFHDLREEEAIERSQGSITLKNEVWKLQILPKIKQFLWNVISGAVPSYVALCTRGVRLDPTCQRCCYDEEDINHVLFLCPHASAIWRCANSPLANQFTNNLEVNITMLLQLASDMKDDKFYQYQSFWILWYVWKSRNEFLFNHRNVHPSEDARRAKEANGEWVQCVRMSANRRVEGHIDIRWEPPPEG